VRLDQSVTINVMAESTTPTGVALADSQCQNEWAKCIILSNDLVMLSIADPFGAWRGNEYLIAGWLLPP